MHLLDVYNPNTMHIPYGTDDWQQVADYTSFQFYSA